MTILFEIMAIINYLHRNNFVYRDLKYDNVLIDQNKNIFLVDFDRMMKIDDKTEYDQCTKDFSSSFVDPEVNNGNISFANDVFSIGQMIYYIINEENPSLQINNNKIKTSTNNLHLQQI